MWLVFNPCHGKGANNPASLFVHQMFVLAAPETGADATMQSANHTRRLRPALVDLKIPNQFMKMAIGLLLIFCRSSFCCPNLFLIFFIFFYYCFFLPGKLIVQKLPLIYGHFSLSEVHPPYCMVEVLKVLFFFFTYLSR